MLSKKHGSFQLITNQTNAVFRAAKATHLFVIMRKSESLTLAWAKYLYLAKRPFSILWKETERKYVNIYTTFKIIRSGQNRGKMSPKRKLSQQASPLINSISFKDDDGHVARGGRGGGGVEWDKKNRQVKQWKNVNILFGNQDSEKWQKLTGWWNKQNTKQCFNYESFLTINEFWNNEKEGFKCEEMIKEWSSK